MHFRESARERKLNEVLGACKLQISEATKHAKMHLLAFSYCSFVLVLLVGSLVT